MASSRGESDKPKAFTSGREASEESIGGGEDFVVPGRGEAVAGLVAALSQGQVLVREAIGLGKEFAKVLLGTSEMSPAN